MDKPQTTAPKALGRAVQRYGVVAQVLHWLIAALILTQIGLGWYMNEWLPDHSAAQDRITTLHISVGLTTLILIVARIIWRLVHRPPPQPAGLPAWERLLAGVTHFLFYLLMLALPLTGWLLVSVHPDPIQIWGLPWPHLPGASGLFATRPSRHLLQQVHTNYLIWIILANLGLHVAGALKHQFDGHAVLWRMLPGGRR